MTNKILFDDFLKTKQEHENLVKALEFLINFEKILQKYYHGSFKGNPYLYNSNMVSNLFLETFPDAIDKTKTQIKTAIKNLGIQII